MSLSHLVGTDEPPSESIRALLAEEWGFRTIVQGRDIFPATWMSRYGTLNRAAGAPVTANDRRMAIEAGPLIYLRDGAATPETYNNDFVEISQVVYIDIFDESRKHIHDIRNFIDATLLKSRPNATVQISKSDNTASAIVYIDPPTPTWNHIDPVEQLGITEQYAGEIEVTIQRNTI